MVVILDVWHIAYKWSPLWLSAWKPYHLFLQKTSPSLSLDCFPVDYRATLWNLSIARVSSYIQSPVAVFTLHEDKSNVFPRFSPARSKRREGLFV